jgi:hypothetical protein
MTKLLSKAGMTCFISRFFAAVLLCGMFSVTAFSQSNVQRIISYQGQVKSTLPLNGVHKITVNFYIDRNSKTSIWHGEYEAEILNGVFNILLGSGKSPLPDSRAMDRRLWIGLRVDDGEEMKPLAEMASVPYALNVADKSITSEKLSDDLRLSLSNHIAKTFSATSFADLTSDTNTSAAMVVGSGASLSACGGTITANNYAGIVGIVNGGTGNSSLTSNGVLLGNGTSALNITTAGSTDEVLRVGSGGGAPAFGAINLSSSSAVTGILPLANGGNGSSFPWYVEGNDLYAVGSALPTPHTYQPIIGSLNTLDLPWFEIQIEGKPVMRYTRTSNTVGVGVTQSSVNICAYPVVGNGNLISNPNSNVLTVGAIIAGGGGCQAAGDCPGTAPKFDAARQIWNRVNSNWGTVGGGSGNWAGYNANASEYFGADHDITAAFQTVAGGYGNFALGDDAAIAGGQFNTVSGHEACIIGGSNNLASGDLSTVGGGFFNKASGLGSFVGGGDDQNANHCAVTVNNEAAGDNSSIVGGINNKVNSGANNSAIGGGNNNTITGTASAIAGGHALKLGGSSFGFSGQSSNTQTDLSGSANITALNDVDVWLTNVRNQASQLRFYEANNTPGSFPPANVNFTSFKAGAQTADISYTLPTILGGSGTLLYLNNNSGQMAWTSTGTSGQVLKLSGSTPIWADPSSLNLNWYAEDPTAFPAGHSKTATGSGAVSHGLDVAASGAHSNIGGGENQSITTTSNHSTISGGESNTITASDHATIGGGKSHTITAREATISGGEHNIINSHHAAIGGGQDNSIASASEHSVIGGGSGNVIGDVTNVNVATNESVIGGGYQNKIYSWWSGIGGGAYNKIFPPTVNEGIPYISYIGGGEGNYIDPNVHGGFIGGGLANEIYSGTTGSTIAGGSGNIIQSDLASIPGGGFLSATSYAQTVIGTYNYLFGSAIWSNFKTTHAFDPLFIIGNGDGVTRSNAYEVSNNGRATVFGSNSNNTDPVMRGTRTIDNTAPAWGYVNAAGTMVQGFGATSTVGTDNVYTITVDYRDPHNPGTQVAISSASITATIVYNSEEPSPCYRTIAVEPINSATNTFTVRIIYPFETACIIERHSFMFHVYAR